MTKDKKWIVCGRRWRSVCSVVWTTRRSGFLFSNL